MSLQSAKYRPSLTISNIRHILTLAKKESPISQESVNVIKTLSPFLAKIENGVIEPAYTITEAPSILSELGGKELSYQPALNKAIFNQECYKKYKESQESCTLEEIASAREHAYINDLMSPAEEYAYEQEINTLAENIRKEI